jgi:hypothetical protein
MLCQQSALQALLTCTMPRELHEDIQELGEYCTSSSYLPYLFSSSSTLL